MTTGPTHQSEEKIKETQADLDNMVTALNSASITIPSIAKKKKKRPMQQQSLRDTMKQKTFYPRNDVNQFITALNKAYVAEGILVLIRRIISPNQDDLSYLNRTSFSGQQKLGKLPNTVSLAEQHRPVQTSHWRLFNNSSSMDT